MKAVRINKAIYASGGPGTTGTKQPNSPTNSKIAQIMIMRVVMVQKYEFTIGKIQLDNEVSIHKLIKQ